MDAQGKERRGHLMPAMVSVIVAAVCTAAILLMDFGPGSGSIGSRNVRMITAAAVARAGAIEIQPEPPTGRPAT